MNMLDIFIVLALFATIGALVMGIGSMARGGDYDKQHSGQYMMARVGLQAATLVFLLLALVMG